jgi:hypothetical protein
MLCQEWNVEWLFLNSTSATVKCPGDCTWKRKSDALLHLKSVASRIRAADADVIVLVEVQDCNVGRMLLREVDDPTLRFYLIPGSSGFGNTCLPLVADSSFSMIL